MSSRDRNLEDLLEQLSKRGFVDIQDRDPRVPPELPDHEGANNDISDPPDYHEIDINKVLKPLKKESSSQEVRPFSPIIRDEYDENLNEIVLPDELDWELDQILGDEGRQADCDAVGGPVAVKTQFEVDAWYAPFHFYGADYGIYITQRGLIKTTIRLAKRLPNTRSITRYERQRLKLELYKAATLIPFVHEHYHHKCESFCTKLELIEGQPKFIPQKSSVYDSTFMSDENLEEALANGEILRRIKKEGRNYGSGIFSREWEKYGFKLEDVIYQDSITQFEKAPGGYRRAQDFVNHKGTFNQKKYDAVRFEHFSQMQAASLNHCSDKNRWLWATEMGSPIFNKNTVVREVLPIGGTTSLPSSAAPLMQVSSRQALSKAKSWGIKEIKRGRTVGDHQWLENNCGDKNHIDTGRHALGKKDWEALLGLINNSWGTNFKANARSINSFMRGPKHLR